MVKASQVSPCCVQTLSLVHMYTVLEAEEDSPTHFKHVVFTPEQAFMAVFILGQMCDHCSCRACVVLGHLPPHDLCSVLLLFPVVVDLSQVIVLLQMQHCDNSGSKAEAVSLEKLSNRKPASVLPLLLWAICT